MKTLILNAHVLTLDAEDREYARADILVDGDRIAAIGPDLPETEDAKVIDAAGKLAMPGLINGHFHSQANMLAGALANRPLELFMLFEVPPLGTAEPDPRLVYLQTMLGAIEMLKCGVTAVHDCGLCTACDLDRYYSYRAEKGRTGRMLAFLSLL